MAKPRIFVSSTYYDLKHIRRHIESFIKQLGYESVLFESGDIPFHHNQPLDESCYAEIETCHILILIIGGNYGSASTLEEVTTNKDDENKMYQFYNSITKKEYEKARDKGIPIFIFVDKGVYAEYGTFKKNRKNYSINYAHVESVNVFKLLDDIISQRTNNFVRGFENFDDITSWLKDQWAGLFADFLAKRSTDAKLKNLEDQIEELKGLSNTLKVYNEILVRSSKDIKDGTQIIEKEENKLLVRRATRFSEEPFIRYLIRQSDIETNPLEIFHFFSRTHTLDTFCKKIKVRRNLSIALNKRANNEYLRLRNDYLNENNNIDNQEDDNLENSNSETND